MTRRQGYLMDVLGIPYTTEEACLDAWRGRGGLWTVDVYDDGIAYTSVGTFPDDDEIQHVQDFFAGKYQEHDPRTCGGCKAYGPFMNPSKAGVWK